MKNEAYSELTRFLEDYYRHEGRYIDLDKKFMAEQIIIFLYGKGHV